ncbi:hypothetical protein KKI24_18935 [bacterium]|nr:hypothetical protein [bacterium]
MNQRQRFAILILGLFFLLSPFITQAGTVYQLDFSKQKNGSATDWFKENEFKLQTDADKVKTRFENGVLYLEVDKDINGLFTKSVRIEGATKVKIEWGVNRYPDGANWETGKLREAIGFIISFGTEKVSSGSMVVPDVPYFIGIFLGQQEKEGKAYTGNYFKKGGRYFCSPCGSKAGETVVTDFDLSETFKKQFGKTVVPFISGIGIEIDARDTDGKSQAVIKSITFYSP